MIVLVEFHIELCEILLTACTDQSLYNLSIIKVCSACAKKATVETGSDCLFIASKIDIICFSRTRSEFDNYQL